MVCIQNTYYKTDQFSVKFAAVICLKRVCPYFEIWDESV